MKAFVDIAIPAVVFFMMTVVGLELTIDNFKRVLHRPKIMLTATLGQFLILPLVAVGLVQVLPIKPYIAAGILLIAACPGGAVSNYYTYLAKANTALSVSLTALSCLTAFVMMPIVLKGMEWYLGEFGGIQIPAAAMISELLKMLLLPILLGMTIRYLKPEVNTQYGRLLKRLTLLALIALIAGIIWKSAAIFLSTIADTALASLAFAIVSMLLGLGLGRLCRLNAHDRFALLIEFAVRNVAIAIVIAVSVLQRVEFAVFGIAYFLAQVPLILLVIALFRARRSSLRRKMVSV